ncbi:MAG: two-component sensor histidine kinase [Proteobacteria bacterium]|nr:two-component sensor histidine kinase [Pseudomonadota bacterium]MBU1738966.1 two-component sensor histidine kinase [Pseudomonadota bacterium]
MGPDKTKDYEPFGLVKFFSFTTLLVFLVFAPVLATLISNHANGVMLRRSEEYALVSARNINHQVYDRFVLPSFLRYGSLIPQHPGQQKRLDAIIRDITHGLNVESVSILDQKNNMIVYSTTSGRVGQEGEGLEQFQMAKAGRTSSLLQAKGSFINLLPGREKPSYRLISYIPFRSEKTPSSILGVIEIIQDLSEDYEATIRLKAIITLISFLCMFCLFVVLRLIVARADKIIDARARERQVLEDKLHRSEHLAGLGKMVASVSHEIKNPLGIVRSTAEMLRKRLGETSPANVQLASVIIEETVRLDGIVREFLDFARPREIKLKPASIAEVVRGAAAFISPELDKNKIECTLNIDENLKPIPIDRELLYRALLNVLINGIQAMKDGGMLKITVKGHPAENPKNSGVTIEISDNGPGITDEGLQQIFKPFYTDKYRGTGLGLAIVKNIIDSHKGRIEVASSPGEGTVFSIKLEG